MDSGFTRKEKADSGNFFETLDHRLRQIMRENIRFRIKIGGYIIEIRLPSEKDLKEMKAYLAGQITNEDGKADAVFHFWTEDHSRYFGEGNTQKSWIHEDEKGHIQSWAGEFFIGMNPINHSFYHCRNIQKAKNAPYRMIPLLHLWAAKKDMRLIHGAVVGVNGKGVVISAHGGGGKSTLSVSCLLAGMNFISDDYFLINNHGPLWAMPTETIVKLNTDMMEQMKLSLPVIWTDASRNNKKTFDASEYNFSKELSVKAVICPQIADCDEPQIVAAEPIPTLMELIHSTLMQKMVKDYTKEAHEIFTRFFGLPAYKIWLSKNLEKNAEALKTFIEGRL